MIHLIIITFVLQSMKFFSNQPNYFDNNLQHCCYCLLIWEIWFISQVYSKFKTSKLVAALSNGLMKKVLYFSLAVTLIIITDSFITSWIKATIALASFYGWKLNRRSLLNWYQRIWWISKDKQRDGQRLPCHLEGQTKCLCDFINNTADRLHCNQI